MIIFFSVNIFNVKVNASEKENSVFIDGIEYTYYIDGDGNMEINATNDDSYGKLILDKDGVAEITVLDENNELNQYEAKIEDLSENNVNITVLDDDNEIVEEYDDEDDLLVDEYECQAAVTV